MSPSPSQAERERVAALGRYQILDTPAESAYDDLTRVTAALCDAPMALVSLLDERRQWVKSAHGLARAEMPRDISLCAHTILQSADEVLEVPDTTKDPRFSSNPFVTGPPHVRFYAGVPLVDSDGWALGSLGVLDIRPRDLTESQRTNLRALARLVMAQMDARLRTFQLAEQADVNHAQQTVLRLHHERLSVTQQEAARLLDLSEKSRRALLTILEDEQRSSQELQRSNRALRMRSRCNEAVIWAQDENSLLEHICRIAVELDPNSLAFVAYSRDDAEKSIYFMAHSGDDQGHLGELRLSWDPASPNGQGPTGQCIREGEVVVCPDLTKSLASESNVEASTRWGYRGIVCLPLTDSSRTFGLLALYSKDDLSEMGEGEVKLLQELAEDLAFGIGALRTRAVRAQAEIDLQTSVREKEALLKEVHHRVKNNLQIIASMMRLEGRRKNDALTKGVFQEMQTRIQSMALLHETMYRTDNFAHVDLGVYLRKLVNQLFRSMSMGDLVQLHLDLDPARVDMDQAIPCGLIVNELATNALKHGFANGRRGDVWVSLKQEGDPRRLSVVVRNNGTPMKEGLDLQQRTGLGLQLVSDLTRQLRGTFTFSRKPDCEFRIVFTPSEAHVSEGTRISREPNTQGRITQ